MIFLVLGAGALAFFVWLGRGGNRRDGPSLLWTLASVAAAGAAVFVGLRGFWYVSLPLVAVSLFLSRRPGFPRFRRPNATHTRPSPATPSTGMSVAEARDILGVPPGATRPEIEAAFRRLMLRAHPDHGGSAGLASRINAARDRLLG